MAEPRYWDYMGALYQPLSKDLVPQSELMGHPGRPDTPGTVLILRLGVERRQLVHESSPVPLGRHDVALHFQDEEDLRDWLHGIEDLLEKKS